MKTNSNTPTNQTTTSPQPGGKAHESALSQKQATVRLTTQFVLDYIAQAVEGHEILKPVTYPTKQR